MIPSSEHLLGAISDVLRTRIAPLLADQPWPSSELRSIDALLTVLAARVVHERDVLIADNADLDGVLADLATAGIALTRRESAGELDLHENNLVRRENLEQAIHLIHDGLHPELVASVRSYLVRSATREHALYGPLAGRALF